MSPFRYVVETITMIRKLYIGFSVVILSILIVIGYAYYNSLEESKMLEWNNHTYEVMREADVLLTSLVNMETGIRGYVVTGDLVFLAPYTNGEKEYQRSLQKIKYLTEDNPNQQSRIASLENEESHW